MGKTSVATTNGPIPRYVTVQAAGTCAFSTFGVPHHAAGTSSEANPLHPANAPVPMPATLSGITTAVSLPQFWNAYPPMLVTLSGIVTFVSVLHPENASLPMSTTLSGIITSVNPLQPLNTALSMLVTLPGIVTSVKPLHPLNA